MGEMINPVDGYYSASVAVECLLDVMRTTNIDVHERPTVWTHEGAKTPSSLLDVMVSQCHDKMSCLNASPPSLRFVCFNEMLRPGIHIHSPCPSRYHVYPNGDG